MLKSSAEFELTDHASQIGALSNAPVQSSSRMKPVGLFLSFMLLGVALTIGGVHLSARMGFAGALALVMVGVPLGVAIVLGVREGLVKLPALWRSLTWWHWLWLLLLVSGFILRTRELEEIKEQALDAAAIFRISLVGITAFVLLLRLVLRRPTWTNSLFSGLVGVMALFALLCIASTFWSVNAPWTLYKSLEYLVDVALIATILAAVRSVETYKSLLDWTWFLTGVLIVVAWVEAPIWPEEALEGQFVPGILPYRLAGVLPGQGSNALGTLGAIIAAVAACRFLFSGRRTRSRLWYGLLLVLGLGTMVFTQTRAAMGGFVLGILVVLVLIGRLRRAAVIAALSAAAVASAGLGSGALAFLQRGQSAAELTSLTGRVEWWGAAFESFKHHPFTGLGAFAAPFSIWQSLGVRDFGPLHSDYVESLVEVGVPGPVLLLIAILGCWWVLVRYLRHHPAPSMERQLALECAAVLAIISVRSMLMNLITFHPPLQFFAILGFAEFLRRRQSRDTRSAVG